MFYGEIYKDWTLYSLLTYCLSRIAIQENIYQDLLPFSLFQAIFFLYLSTLFSFWKVLWLCWYTFGYQCHIFRPLIKHLRDFSIPALCFINLLLRNIQSVFMQLMLNHFYRFCQSFSTFLSVSAINILSPEYVMLLR